MHSPFKFLDSFTKEDKEIFFGRDNEIEELYRKSFESKIMLVYGVSGTGKSSLINCGLANKFNDADWLPINLRRAENINTSLARSIEKNAISPIKIDANKDKTVLKALQSLYLDHFKPIFLIFDQFEELFIFGSKSEQAQFIQLVKLIVDSDLQCRFLFVIREEYLASITEFEKVIPSFLNNRVRIEKMTHANAMQAIEGPCKINNILVEQGFSQTLLEKLSPNSTEVELTYLQVFLDKIFKLSAKENYQFTHKLIEQCGNVSDLLGSFLEEQISQLADPDVALVLLKAFVSVKGTKRQITQTEALEYAKTLGKLISPEKIKELIQHFVNLRILRDQDENARYELRHDALAAKIFEKITVFEKDLMEMRQFIENAYENYKKRGILLSQTDLKYFAQYEDKLFLGGELLEFVRICKDDIKKRIRLQNRITLLCVAVLLLLIGLFVKYFSNESTKNKASKLALQSLVEVNSPEKAYQLAIEADSIFASPYTKKAIFQSFNLLRAKANKEKGIDPWLKVFNCKPLSANILQAYFTKDGNFIYGALQDSTWVIWEKNGILKTQMKWTEAIDVIKVSADNKYVAIGNKNGNAAAFDFSGRKLFSFKANMQKMNFSDCFSFAAAKGLLAVADENAIKLYDIETGNIKQTINHHKDAVTAVCFSPDDRFLSTAAYDSTLNILYYNKNKKEFSTYSSVRKNFKIRSLDFYKNSNYVLLSGDSIIAIHNLMGEEISTTIFDPLVITHQSLSIINDASFSKSPVCIIIERYSSNKGFVRKQFPSKWIFGERIFGGRIDSIAGNWVSASLSVAFIDQYEVEPLMCAFDISPKHVYQAANSCLENKTMLMNSMDRFNFVQLHVLDGIKPQFSPDGNVLLVIDDKKLVLYPAHENYIRHLIEKDKLMGDF